MIDKNGDGVPDMEVSIDGVKTRTKDLFPDAAQRQDFHTKVKLLKSPSSGESDGMTELPSVSDQLFSPKGKDRSGEPDGMDPQMEKLQKKKGK